MQKRIPGAPRRSGHVRPADPAGGVVLPFDAGGCRARTDVLPLLPGGAREVREPGAGPSRNAEVVGGEAGGGGGESKEAREEGEAMERAVPVAFEGSGLEGVL